MRRLAWFFLVIVAGLGGGCGSDEDEAGTEFEQACQSFCDAADEAGCGVSNCQAGCSYIEDAAGSCAGAYGALYACAANGPVQCVNGLPQPTSTDCVEEAVSLGECIQQQPCLDLCATVQSAGCGGDACLARCVADEQAATFCSIELDDLRECEMEGGLVCQGDAPIASDACTTLADELRGCVASNDPCAAQCMSAELAGCGGESRQACIDACNQILEGGTCSSEYQQLVSCRGQNGVACEGTELSSPPACSAQQDAYDTCAMPIP